MSSIRAGVLSSCSMGLRRSFRKLTLPLKLALPCLARLCTWLLVQWPANWWSETTNLRLSDMTFVAPAPVLLIAYPLIARKQQDPVMLIHWIVITATWCLKLHFDLQVMLLLRTAEFKPFCIYVKPPSLKELRTSRLTVQGKAKPASNKSYMRTFKVNSRLTVQLLIRIHLG